MSIYKVAELAGVSKSTVSRVINGGAGVSDSTVNAVRAAMDELGYRPNPRRPGPKPRRASRHAGASRASLRRGTVALVNVGRGVELLSHPYFVRVQDAIRSVLQARGVSLVLDDLREGVDRPICIQEDRVDGVLLTGRSPCETVQRNLGDVAAVWMSGGARGPLFADHALADNYAVGAMAVRYLMRHDRRRLLFLNCDPFANSSQSRGEAFVEYARQAGAEAEALTYESGADPKAEDWLDDSLHDRMSELLGRVLRRRTRPDGVFVPYDQHAALLQRILQERGVNAGPPGPETEVVLISAGNDAYLATMPQRIASIDPNPMAMAAWAAPRLLQRIDDPSMEPARMLVAPRLVEPPSRGSSDAAAALGR